MYRNVNHSIRNVEGKVSITLKKASLVLSLVLLLSLVPLIPVSPVLATDPTTSITVTRYDTDGTTILDQTTVSYGWMMDNLPVQGDGVTHYYHQGPTFDHDNLWDPGEMENIDSRDMGAVLGTDVKDLCDLVGGASSGDVIKIASPDGFSKSFDYEDVYTPEPEQGKMVITWYRADDGASTPSDGFGYPPNYYTGMRLVFFAQTLNSEGKHVFGNWDMHETLAESRWHYYVSLPDYWPSSSGLSVKWVSGIKIYSGGGQAETDSAILTAKANVVLKSVGIILNRDSIDFGDIKPGESSAVETVGITNIGSIDVNVTLEVVGDDSTADSFYEQSLYIDDELYDIEDIIAFIAVDDSYSVDTQLRVPDNWSAAGLQEAQFVFWAEASG
jgi:hypothetical protein